MKYSDVEYDKQRYRKKKKDKKSNALRITAFISMIIVMISLCSFALVYFFGIIFATMLHMNQSGSIFEGIGLFVLSLGPLAGLITGLVYAGKYTDYLRKKL